MLFSYNSNGLRSLPVVEAVKAVADAGYDGVELSLHEAHLHPFAVDAKIIEDLKKIFEQKGIQPVCLATGANNLLSPLSFEPSLISLGREERKARIALIRKSIEIAKLLSIPVVNFASGIRRDEVTKDAAWDYLVEGINECLAGIGEEILVIEPEPDFFISTTTEAIKLLKQFDSPNLQLNLDVGHVYCCESDYLEAIRLAIPYTRHIHIEDIKNKIHHHEIPGEGDIDLRSVLVMLKEYNYAHYISVELYHHSDCWKMALSKSRANLLRMMRN